MPGATAPAPLPHDWELVGRSREVAAVEEFLGDVEQLPAALRLVGEPGIGKSTIWNAALATAKEFGYVILEARPEQSERSLAFAALGDLLGDAFAAVNDRLPVPQRRALAAALLLDDAASEPEARTLGVATLSTLRALAETHPVLVAIDDEQWLDRASAATLGFALRRITDESVAVLVASRPAPAVLETRLRVQNVELGGLSLGALHAIIVERLGTVLPRPQLRRLHELSRGNPFLALELIRAANAGRLRLDAPDKGSADLDRLVGARLDALPHETQLALFVAAAAARPTTALITDALQIESLALLAAAVDAGIVEVRGFEVHFTHPLLASAAYGAVLSDDRREIHGRLARLTDDPVERARHLAQASVEPDEMVAADVERAAQAVFRRGAPAAAAELAEMAVRLTPDGHQAQRRQRVANQAEFLFESGDTAAAASLLDHFIAETPPGPSRAAALGLMARIRHFGDDVESGIALNERAIAEAHGDDRLLAGLHEGTAWGLFLMRQDLARAARHARSAVSHARKATDPIALGEAYAVSAVTAQAIGRSSNAAIERAMALEPAFAHVRVLRHPTYAKAYLLLCQDRLDEAWRLLEQLLARAEDHGDESAMPSILVQLSMAELLRGDWAAAEEHAAIGSAYAEQSGQRPSRSALLGRRALLSVWRGDLDEGEGRAREALELAGSDSQDPITLRRSFARGGEMAAWALGAAANARGRFADAASSLTALADTLLGAGLRDPGELRFLPDLVETFIGLARLDEADAVATDMATMARTGRSQSAIGIAARSRAQVLAARGNLEHALVTATDAVECLSAGPLVFDAARAQLLKGQLERRVQSKRAARETLDQAIATFARLGAERLRAEAEAEVGRIGGRGQSDGGLTPTESRVAELVVKGLSNKEVAAALSISSKTVELHLSHVYAKLDVASRTELVRRMSIETP